MSSTATTPPSIGGKWLTGDAMRWRDYFLRKSNVEPKAFDDRILHHALGLGSPKIGGNAVLLAAVDLGLYQGTSP
jgi:hypothetical protein